MQLQVAIAILIFMGIVLTPAAILWYLGIRIFYRGDTNSAGSFERALQSGATGSYPRVVPNKPLWVASFVIVAYAVYGIGLASRWGDRTSFFLAMATSIVFLLLGLASHDRIRSGLTAYRGPGVRLGVVIGPAFVTPALISFVMGGVDWRMSLALTVVGPAVLAMAFLVQWLSGTGRCSVVRVANRLGCHTIAHGLFRNCQSQPQCLPIAVRTTWRDKS